MGKKKAAREKKKADTTEIVPSSLDSPNTAKTASLLTSTIAKTPKTEGMTPKTKEGTANTEAVMGTMAEEIRRLRTLNELLVRQTVEARQEKNRDEGIRSEIETAVIRTGLAAQISADSAVYSAEIDQLKRDLRKLESEKVDSEESLKEIKQKFESLLGEKNVIEDKFLSLVGEKEDLKQDAEEKNAEIDRLKKDLMKLESEKADSDEILKEVRQKFESLIAEKSILEEKFHSLVQEKKELKEMTEKKDAENFKDIERLNGYLQKLMNEKKDLESKKKIVSGDLEHSRQQFESLKEEYNNLDEKFCCVVREKKELTEEAEKKNAQNLEYIRRLKGDLIELMNRKTDLESENKIISRNLEDSRQQFESLKEEYSNLDDKLHFLVQEKVGIKEEAAKKNSENFEEIKRLKENLQKLMTEKADLESESKIISINLGDSKQQFESLRGDYSKLEEKFCCIIQEKEQLMKQAEKKNTENLYKIEQLRGDLQKLMNEKADLESEIKALSGVLSDSRQQIESLREDHSNLEDKFLCIVKEKEELKEEAEKNSAEIDRLKGDLQKSMDEKADLESENKIISKNLVDSRQQFECLCEDHGNLEGKFHGLLQEKVEVQKEAEQKIAENSAEVERLRDDLRRVSNEKVDLESEIKIISTNLGDSMQQFQSMQKDYANLEGKFNNLLQEKDELQKEAEQKNTKNFEEIKRLNGELLISENEKVDLLSEISIISKNLEESRQQIVSLQEDLRNLEHEFHGLVQERDELQKEAEKKNAENSEEIDRLNRDLSESVKEKADLESEISIISKTLGDSRQQLESLQEDYGKLDRKFHDVLRERDELQKEAEKKSAENSAEIERLNEDLHKFAKEKSDLESKIGIVSGNLGDSRLQFESLQSEINAMAISKKEVEESLEIFQSEKINLEKSLSEITQLKNEKEKISISLKKSLADSEIKIRSLEEQIQFVVSRLRHAAADLPDFADADAGSPEELIDALRRGVAAMDMELRQQQDSVVAAVKQNRRWKRLSSAITAAAALVSIFFAVKYR